MRNWLLFIVLFTSCSQQSELTQEYLVDLAQWRSERLDDLRSKDGYLSLVGLYWLSVGENTYGSDSSNAIIFPSAANPYMGSVILTGDSVIHRNLDGIEELMNPLDSINAAPVYELNSFSWFAIKRGEAYGIRLRDSNSDALNTFTDVANYPTDPDLHVVAKFVPFDPPKMIPIENIVGFTISTESPGQLQFEIEGKKETLDVMIDGETYFIIFGDPTNGSETYGGGRYMHSEFPDENSEVILDFNKSYNPPCAFTEFATCPLPPKQNILKVEIKAGEMNFVGGIH